MTAYVKGDITLVVDNISYIQEHESGKSVSKVFMRDGSVIEINDNDLKELKSML